MKYLSVILLLFSSLCLLAQTEKAHIRKGNKNYNSSNFESAQTDYLKAVSKSPESFEAAFNLGDAMFKQEQYEEAVKQFETLSKLELEKVDKAKVYHNLGNSYLMSQKLEESVEAYKNALRNNPSDKETKYNLAYAQYMLKKQQQQNQDQNKDNKDQNKDKQDQEKKDKEEEKQDQEKKEEEKEKEQEEEKEAQPKEEEISKEDAQRLLESLEEDEKELQKKLKKAKVKKQNGVIEKDW